jgi:hypothetical protein
MYAVLGAITLGLPACGEDAVSASEGGETDDAGGSTTEETDGPSVPGEVPAAPAVLHRLTESQINNSIRDVFGDASLAVALPPEFEVEGFSNIASVRSASPYLIESLQRDFQAVTGQVMRSPGAWLQCAADGGDDPASCGHASLDEVGAQLFRRPLTAEDQGWVHGAFDSWNADAGFSPAMELSLQMLLQSPDFLYRVERGDTERANGAVTPLTDWEVAARLSLLLWNRGPDAELRQLAAEGKLRSRGIVREQARRMIRDPKSRGALLEFHRQWLDADLIDLINFDAEYHFPENPDAFRPSVFRASLEIEFDRFILGTLFSVGTYEALLSSREAWVSDLTAPLYNAQTIGSGERVSGYDGEDGWSLELFDVTLPADQRAGFLTSGPFLASHAHAVDPAPILRGVFVRERLLCLATPVPPDDVPAIDEGEQSEARTNRERYAEHSSNPACAGCHQSIDGIGFTLENYSALGAWRTEDNGYPVDASGELLYTDVDGPLQDGVDLAERLAVSRTAHDCMVTQWFRYAMHRDVEDQDEQTLADLRERFWNDGGEIPNLLVDLVSSDAFLYLVEPSE